MNVDLKNSLLLCLLVCELIFFLLKICYSKVQITLFKALIQSVAAVGFNRAASRYLNQYQECVQGIIEDDDLT